MGNFNSLSQHGLQFDYTLSNLRALQQCFYIKSNRLAFLGIKNMIIIKITIMGNVIITFFSSKHVVSHQFYGYSFCDLLSGGDNSLNWHCYS